MANMIFRLDDNKIAFPDPGLAEEDGLLAVGGDLSVPRLLLAYHHGIFPWFSDETPVMWYSPPRRFVLFPQKIKISKSMSQVLNSGRFSLTFNQDFKQVIRACALTKRNGQEGTWITAGMQDAYIRLHELGHAHSVEVWENGILAGGLYGLEINTVFCGESMFSKISNASKAALISLIKNRKYSLIDCQVYTAHLESMGAEYISREEYTAFLRPRG